MEKKELINELLSKINADKYRKLLSTLEDGCKGLYVILKVIKNSDKEVIAGDIASKLNITTARVAAALNNLEKKKWIIKYKSSLDGRKTIVELTDLGKNVLKRREEEIISVLENLFVNLTDLEIIQLINLLNKINS